MTRVLDGPPEPQSALESEWRRLAELRGSAFLTPEWFRCWFEHYGHEATSMVPLVEEGGRLRGLLPLAVGLAGRPRVCRIAGANLGDRFQPVCEQGDEAEVAAAAGEALGSVAGQWSILALDHVEVDPPWIAALAEATGLRLTTRRRRADSLPLIELSSHESWDDYLASRSSNLRQQVRRFTRRAGKEHSLLVRRSEDSSELAADMRTFFELHDRRRQAQGGSSLTSERARAFHSDFAAACLKRGWLRLWFLELDGEAVASWYGWRLGDRYSYFNGGFDPEWSALSPGLVLQAAVIKSALEEDAAIFDFLLGDERYKFRFAERTLEVSDVTLARALPHPASAVASLEHGMRRAGRMLPDSARRRLSGLARRSLLRGRGR